MFEGRINKKFKLPEKFEDNAEMIAEMETVNHMNDVALTEPVASLQRL
jgi:hypothetical protein